MMIPHNTVVAIADGEDLVLFRNAGSEAALNLLRVPTPSLRPTNAGSGGRHRSSTANPDNRLQQEDGYAAAVAHWLNRESAAGRIDGLMVIAAARTLGELRQHYDPRLRSRLIGEISKDLIGRSADEIGAAIAAH